MAQGDVFHALKHTHRQKILRALRRRPRTYSTLLAKVDPDGNGTGRFNYHLKVLKDAGLVEVDETLYRPTANGFAALQLLAQAPEGKAAPPRRRVQLAVVGSLLGVGGIGLFLLLSIVLAPAVLEAPGTARDPGANIPTSVTELADRAASPQVAVDSNGNAIVIWTQDDGVHINIWANRFVAGVGWGTLILIEKDDSGDALYPMLAMDPAGNAWAVWTPDLSDPGPPNVWANRFDPEAGWGEATVIARDARLQDIGIDASGALTVIWNRYTFPNAAAIYADRFVPGIGWVGATAIQPDGRNGGVQLAVDAEGRAIAVWYDPDRGIVASRYVPNEGWGPTILVRAGYGGYTTPLSIAMDSDGGAMTVWERYVDSFDNPSGSGEIFAARFVPGFGWGEAVLIARDVPPNSWPQVAVDAEGNAIAGWLQPRPDENWLDLFVSRFDLGFGWGDRIRIAEKVAYPGFDNDKGDFALAMEPGGEGVLLYDNSSGIFAARFLPGVGWNTPSLLGTDGPHCPRCPPSAPGSMTAVAIDTTGNVIAIWEAPKSARFGVLASRFLEPTSLEKLARDTRALERNQLALEAASARIAALTGWLAVSLSLLVALIVLFGVLFVVYWNPRRGLAEYREMPDDPGRPPGPGG